MLNAFYITWYQGATNQNVYEDVQIYFHMKYKCIFEYFARIVQITAFNKIILQKRKLISLNIMRSTLIVTFNLFILNGFFPLLIFCHIFIFSPVSRWNTNVDLKIRYSRCHFLSLQTIYIILDQINKIL